MYGEREAPIPYWPLAMFLAHGHPRRAPRPGRFLASVKVLVRVLITFYAFVAVVLFSQSFSQVSKSCKKNQSAFIKEKDEQHELTPENPGRTILRNKRSKQDYTWIESGLCVLLSSSKATSMPFDILKRYIFICAMT